MQLLFDNGKNPFTPTKAWEAGLLKGAKVLLYVALSAVIVYIANVVASYHPTTQFGFAEVAVINSVIVWIQNWIQAHQLIKAAQTVPPVTNPPVPTTQG